MNARRLVMLIAALSAHVADASAAGVVTVSQPWVRPAPLHASTPAYLDVGSSEDATLIAVRSPAGGVAMMRGKMRVEAMRIAAGVPLAMSATREHLVVMHLSRKLALGERVPLTLVLRDPAGATRDIDVSAEVRLRSPIDDERRAHGRH